MEGSAETAWNAADGAAARSRFAAERFLALPGMLSAGDTALVANYYRTLIEAGWMVAVQDPVRWVTSNDPVGRALLQQFRPLVEAIAGRPLRDSYTFTAEYLPGAALPMHIDRLQCEYTISLLLDYDPLPEGERSPWPLDVESPLHAETLHFHQARGEGVLIKGRELRHGRPTALDKDRCLVIMLHYVEGDFPDEQMEPY
ncbi:hypothetical protein GCM10011611_63000 [Aliidongia dinghuensis]|uniref:2OG-Fe(II) oxygenase n=1 Tax=Aliidongia dinghuensis TaxID=1867774 RepID=A0A8J3E5J5_9PROT|nr:hypothetical protein GCM10011611_63000 [Aliidongia dinghuensis]